MSVDPPPIAYGQEMVWAPHSPRYRLANVLLSWLVAAVAVLVAAAILPGLTVGHFGEAAVDAVVIAALNALLPPLVAALRLPFTVALGFVLILALDALRGCPGSWPS